VPAESDEGKLRASYFQRARELLAENIDGLDFDLEPTALAWQRSLFVLGRLYHEEGRYDEAIRRLREAIQRYPDAPQVYDAMYRIADSYRQWARAPEEQLRTEETPRGRMLLEQDRNRRLQAAIVEYATLATRLAQVQEARPLSPDEQTLMRSSFFTIGDVYASLQDWPAAIEAFTTAANRFQDRPDCLAAYVQIANAYLRQGRISEAGSTLRQARWVLNQIDESLFVDSALSKEQWKNRLDSLVGDL
jgi:tetratricopeptide (TPR) repeat protein